MAEEKNTLEQESTDLMVRVQKLEIKTNDDYKIADEIRSLANGLKKKILDHFDPHCDRLHKAWKAMTDDRKNHVDPVNKVISEANAKMIVYSNELKRKAEEERKKKEDAARAEEERLRKIKEEQERKWREKQEQAEREAERLRAEGNEEEAAKQEAIAEKAEEKAEEREAEKENIFVAREEVQTETKIEGTKSVIRQNWQCEITDKKKLISACLANPMLSDLVTIDEVALRKLTKSLKNKLNNVDGLRVWDAGSIA